MKAYLCHAKPFRKKPDGSHVYSLFLDNKRQHMPVHAKIISSGIRDVLGVAEVHMFPSTR